MNAETFNSLHPVGTLVFAYPGARPEDIPSTRRLVTRTRTVAQSVGLDRDGVVWVEDLGAYIALTHVDVVTEAEWEAAKLADTEAAESFASLDDRGVAEAEEKRARLFGFIEAGASEGDLPSFATALNEYVGAVLAEAISRVEDPEERTKSPIGLGLGWESAREVLRRMRAEATS